MEPHRFCVSIKVIPIVLSLSKYRDYVPMWFKKGMGCFIPIVSKA